MSSMTAKEDSVAGRSDRDDVVDDDSAEHSMDAADAWMERGSLLRQLRQLADVDDAARQQEAEDDEYNANDDEMETVILSDGTSLLRYESFLRHQRIYDDLKHVDYNFIDFSRHRLIVEQDKSLGKGGFCWDAAYILGEYLSQQGVVDGFLNVGGRGGDEFDRDNASYTCNGKRLRMVELGAGTGLCGMIVAKALNADVTLTDMESLMPLLRRNLNRNFDGVRSSASEHNSDPLVEYMESTGHTKSSCGSAYAAVLDWGQVDHDTPDGHHRFDLVIGADVVASLYDPLALARTIYSLGPVAVISFKERLSSVHREFEQHMVDLFDEITIISPTGCRNCNPAVQILVAKKRKSNLTKDE